MSSPSTQRLSIEPSIVSHTERSAAEAPAFDLFINRDLSLIEFYRRVLEEAQDRRLSLLERVKFSSIFSSLLDDFFMIRVSGLKEQLDDALESPDPVPARRLLKEIRRKVNELLEEQTDCLMHDILPALEDKGIRIVSFDSLDPHEREQLTSYFHENIYPVLTPQAVDPSHPFPYISG